MRFKFESIAKDFNKHINGQLPFYGAFIFGFLPEYASYFLKENGVCYDFGASTGNVEKSILNMLLERKIDFIPVEKNKEMVKNYESKFKIIENDFTEIEMQKFYFATSILSLCFVHPSKRKKFIDDLKNNCEVGGSFLLLEKFVNKGGVLGTIFNRITWRNKLESKEPLENIINKELGLSGVQYPLQDSEVNGMHLVWCYGDFKCYVFLKG